AVGGNGGTSTLSLTGPSNANAAGGNLYGGVGSQNAFGPGGGGGGHGSGQQGGGNGGFANNVFLGTVNSQPRFASGGGGGAGAGATPQPFATGGAVYNAQGSLKIDFDTMSDNFIGSAGGQPAIDLLNNAGTVTTAAPGSINRIQQVSGDLQGSTFISTDPTPV